MTYRDDEDALRARVEALEADRERLREEQARAQEEIERLRRMAGVRPRASTSWTTIAIVAVVVVVGGLAAVVVAGAVVGATLATREATPPPEPREDPIQTPDPVPPPPEIVSHTIEPTWNAAIVSSSGAAPAVGLRCRISARVERAGGTGGTTRVSGLAVECPTQVLYREPDPAANGSRPMEWRVSEQPGARATELRYGLDFSDYRAAPPHVSLSTLARTATVWSDAPPAFRVELDVDELSAPVETSVLFAPAAEPEFRDPVSAQARVESVRGEPIVARGDRCAVEIRPTWREATSCRIHVRCARTVLYGAAHSGYGQCRVENGRVVQAQDDGFTAQDTDPEIRLDLAARTGLVRDEAGGTSFEVSLRLEPER